MTSDELAGSMRTGGVGTKTTRAVPYSSKDFQLEILGQLAEMQEMTEALRELVAHEVRSNEERSKRLPFDGRTLVAVGALALSITGYILQDARNTSRRDAEIETTKTRVTHLEEVGATNTEARVRTEVELGELREGQAEIKRMIAQHDSSSKPAGKRD